MLYDEVARGILALPLYDAGFCRMILESVKSFRRLGERYDPFAIRGRTLQLCAPIGGSFGDHLGGASRHQIDAGF